MIRKWLHGKTGRWFAVLFALVLILCVSLAVFLPADGWRIDKPHDLEWPAYRANELAYSLTLPNVWAASLFTEQMADNQYEILLDIGKSLYHVPVLQQSYFGSLKDGRMDFKDAPPNGGDLSLSELNNHLMEQRPHISSFTRPAADAWQLLEQMDRQRICEVYFSLPQDADWSAIEALADWLEADSETYPFLLNWVAVRHTDDYTEDTGLLGITLDYNDRRWQNALRIDGDRAQTWDEPAYIIKEEDKVKAYLVRALGHIEQYNDLIAQPDMRTALDWTGAQQYIQDNGLQPLGVVLTGCGTLLYERRDQLMALGLSCTVVGETASLEGLAVIDNTWLTYGEEFKLAPLYRMADRLGYYYMVSYGNYLTGWVAGQSNYYFNDQGIMQTGWLLLDTGVYYLREAPYDDMGKCVMDTQMEIDGVIYQFDQYGICQNPPADLAVKE